MQELSVKYDTNNKTKLKAKILKTESKDMTRSYHPW